MIKISILLLLIFNLILIFLVTKKKYLIFNLYFFSMTIFIYIPALIDNNININLGNSLVLNLFFTILGIISGIYLMQNDSIRQSNISTNINKFFRNINKIKYLVIANIVVIISLLLYIFIAKEIPLFLIFNGSDSISQITLARESSFKLLNSPFKSYFTLLRDALLPILIFYFSYFFKGSNLNYKILWLSFVIFSFIFCSASLAKAPIMLVALCILIGINRGISNKFIFKSILFLLPLYYLSMVVTTSYRGLEIGVKFYERIFVVPYKVNELYFEAIPEYINFTKGSSLGRLSFIFTENTINLGNKIYVYITGNKDIISISGSANGGFLASLWADFSYLGIVLGTLIISFSAVALDLLFLGGYKKFTLGLSIYYFCAYQYALLTILPIQNLIYNGVPLFIFILLIMNRNPKRLFN